MQVDDGGFVATTQSVHFTRNAIVAADPSVMGKAEEADPTAAGKAEVWVVSVCFVERFQSAWQKE